MKNTLETSLQFIYTFLGTRTEFVSRDQFPTYELLSSQSVWHESRVVPALLGDIKENSIVYFDNQFAVCYCFIGVQDGAVIIGPYREKNLSLHFIKANYSDSLTKEETEVYAAYHSELPLLSPSTVKLAAFALLQCMFDSTEATLEHTVHCQLSESSPNVMHLLYQKDPSYSDMILHSELDLKYITQLQLGNYHGAISAYKEIMLHRPSRPELTAVDFLEGLTSTRMMTLLALQLAQALTSEAISRLDNFRLRSRLVSTRDECMHLVYGFINDCCTIVRDVRKQGYSFSVQDAIDYIHQNLQSHLSITDIARHCKLSSNWLSSKFRAETGQSISDYILKLRLQQATQLLLYTSLNIQDICCQVGILDNNYFARCFKKYYGKTPTQYRNAPTVRDIRISHFDDPQS